ncbi:MAG: hypothetical protein H0W84_01705 [Bacteroidetes bacterium]|nr:hypothetical protein [Bacteroidota bacterium]
MDKQIIYELEELFTFSPPNTLRRSINEIFYSYLISNKEVLPTNFGSIAEDFYFLIDFLKKADEHYKKKKTISE